MLHSCELSSVWIVSKRIANDGRQIILCENRQLKYKIVYRKTIR